MKLPDRVGTIQSRHLSLLHLQCAPSSVNFSLDGGERERVRKRGAGPVAEFCVLLIFDRRY